MSPKASSTLSCRVNRYIGINALIQNDIFKMSAKLSSRNNILILEDIVGDFVGDNVADYVFLSERNIIFDPSYPKKPLIVATTVTSTSSNHVMSRAITESYTMV